MRRIAVFFWGCILSVSAAFPQEWQDYFIPVDTLDFAHFDADTLAFDMESSLLVPFFEKLDAATANQMQNISILHIGGSHVQAGTMSHRIRQNILAAYPDAIGGRGLIFPYSVAPKCNNPADYRVKGSRTFGLTRNVQKELDCNLGLTGIAVHTDTFAEIRFTLNDPTLPFETDTIVVFGYDECGTSSPCLLINDLGFETVLNDSAHHRFVYACPNYTREFTLQFDADSGNRFTLTGVQLISRTSGITVHSVGVNGASVPSYLACLDFENDLQWLHPDLVIFGIGINDAAGNNFDTLEFKNNYLKLIDKIKKTNPNCAFIFITNNDSYKKAGRKRVVNKNGLLVQQTFYRLAKETKGAVWDQFDIMGGLKSMQKWQNKKLAKNDKIHFTVAGYQLLGDLFFNAFMEARLKVAAHRQTNIIKEKEEKNF